MPDNSAVVVGINDYADSPLRFCANDARNVAHFLEAPQYGFAVTLLLDESATRRGIKDAIEGCLAQNPRTFLFFFAGHGNATDLGTFLATIDAEFPDDGIDLEYLRRIAEARIRPGNALVYVLDCCHSGAASITPSRRISAPVRAEDIATELGSLGGAGRVLLAACKEDQLAHEEARLGQGIFSYHLCEGLIGGAADQEGNVTVPGLYEHVSRAFRAHAVQMPVFKGDIAGQLVLGRGLTPRSRPTSSEEVLQQKESELSRHLDEYQLLLAEELPDRTRWLDHGYRRACTALEALLRWMDNLQPAFPDLVRRPRFEEIGTGIRARRQELCRLESGIRTLEGKAVQEIGHGGFGSVWKIQPDGAHEPTLAYKVYHWQDLDNPAKLARFRRGFHAMELLDHPRVVRVHRLTLCPVGYYMDLIDGPNMRTFSGTIDDPRELIGILLSVAETIAHAHGRGVVHRDVKPENILLSYSQQTATWAAYLTDFDLAWFSTATQLTKSEMLFALYYAPPEQREKPLSAAARAHTVDLYSFGQLLFYTLCGQDPVSPQSNSAVLATRLSKGWSEEAGRSIVDLYGTCTADNPTERPRDFREVADSLLRTRRLLEGIAVDAPVAVDRLVPELAYALCGLEPKLGTEHGSFKTLSGRTIVAIEIVPLKGNKCNLTLRLHCIEAPVLPGQNHEKMRELLMARVGRLLRSFPGVEKTAGSSLPFEVVLRQEGFSLHRAGLEGLASMVGRVVDAIERAT